MNAPSIFDHTHRRAPTKLYGLRPSHGQAYSVTISMASKIFGLPAGILDAESLCSAVTQITVNSRPGGGLWSASGLPSLWTNFYRLFMKRLSNAA